jgi:CheY-like chemotaxis protein
MPPSLVAAREDAPLLALLVHSDPDAYRQYADALTRSAWLIEVADDGRDALAKVFARRPDVVIAATQVAGINGFDLCALLREDVATRAIAIVLLANESSTTDAARARSVGADTLLQKSCPPETLVAEINRLVGLSGELRERARLLRDRLFGLFAGDEVPPGRPRPRRRMLSSEHTRRDTTTPPIPPPRLTCPRCEQPLRYVRSHIGGVTARNAEQWDYFECPRDGSFQYRVRTGKLRRVNIG